jgi:hypothetical protein
MRICVERWSGEERHCAEGDVGEIFLLLLLLGMCGVGGGFGVGIIVAIWMVYWLGL